MPTEDRRIIFTNEEVYNAIYALSAQKQQQKPPAGQIVSIEESDDKTEVTMTLRDPVDEKNVSVSYSRDFIAAALMLFCRGLGIPLPKNSKKTVFFKDAQVMLRVVI